VSSILLPCWFKAIRIINTKPDYHVIKNNCQNFAKFLLKEICPNNTIPETIEAVLRRWQDISSLASAGTLPGIYPQSISSDDIDSFVTASDTYYFSAAETSWITAVDYSQHSVDTGSQQEIFISQTNQSALLKRNY